VDPAAVHVKLLNQSDLFCVIGRWQMEPSAAKIFPLCVLWPRSTKGGTHDEISPVAIFVVTNHTIV